MHIRSTHELPVHVSGSSGSHASEPQPGKPDLHTVAAPPRAAQVADPLHAQPIAAPGGTGRPHAIGLIVPAHAPWRVGERSSAGRWGHHGRVGLKGGADSGDDATSRAERDRLRQEKKSRIDQKLNELAGVCTTLEASITSEQRAADAARRRVDVHRYGLHEAQRLLDDLERKSQQGEAGLDAVLDTQRNEIRDWQRDLHDAERDSDDRSEAVGQLSDTLGQVRAEIARLETQRADVDRSPHS
jgi:hypothetical protein